MNIKYLILLFTVITATQAAQIPHKALGADPLVETIINVLGFVSQALQQLSLELQKVDFSDDGLINLIKDLAIGGNRQFLDRLKKLESGTTDTGRIILECFEAQNETIEGYLATSAQEVGQCVNFEMFGVNWYMDQYIEGLNWLVENFDTYAEDLKNCENDAALPCIFSVMQKNGLTLLQLVAFGAGRVVEITIGVVGGLIVANDLRNCGEKVINNHLDDYSQLIFNNAAACIQDRLR